MSESMTYAGIRFHPHPTEDSDDLRVLISDPSDAPAHAMTIRSEDGGQSWSGEITVWTGAEGSGWRSEIPGAHPAEDVVRSLIQHASAHTDVPIPEVS